MYSYSADVTVTVIVCMGVPYVQGLYASAYCTILPWYVVQGHL